MQQEQHKEKRSFKNNPSLRVEFALKIASIFNQYLPDDKQYDMKKVEEHARNEYFYEQYKKAKLITDNSLKKSAMMAKIKNDYADNEKKTLQEAKGLTRIIFNQFSLDEEKINQNINLLQKVATKEGALEVTSDYIKKIIEFDYTKCFPSTIEEAVETYAENFDVSCAAFCAETILKHSDFATNYKIDKMYNDNIGLFTHAADNGHITSVVANPLYFLLPHQEFDEEIRDIFIGADLLKDSILLSKQYKDIEELSWMGPSLNDMQLYPLCNSNATKFLNQNRKVKEYIDSGKLDKNFPLEKTFTSKGKPIDTIQAFNKIFAGEKVNIQEYSQEQKQELKEALGEQLAFDGTEVINTISTLLQSYKNDYESLEETKGFFTWNSKEFKNLTKELKNFSKDYDQFLTQNNFGKDGFHAYASKCNQFYNAHKKQLEKIEQYNKDYVIYKNKQKEQYASKNKQLNERSINRLTICENAFNEKRLESIHQLFKNNVIHQLAQKENKKPVIVNEANDLNKEATLSKKIDVLDKSIQLENNLNKK